MSELVRFNLPKVQLRVNTTNDTLSTHPTPPHFQQHSHSLLQQRVKMKKEIQDSYIRFRRHKKNNYIKHFSSLKRCSPILEDKHSNTIQIKHQNDKTTFALQAQDIHKSQPKQQQAEHKNPTKSFMRKFKETMTTQNKQLLNISYKPIYSKKNFLARNLSLYESDLSNEEKDFQLQGEKWNYNKFNKSKKHLACFVKLSSVKNKNPSGKSSSLKIQAWRADKISRCKDYYEYEQVELQF